MSGIHMADASLVKRRNLKNDYYSLTFAPFDGAARCKPGQFVHVKLLGSDILFRRAFSVAAVDRTEKSIELIFKVFGRGTRVLGSLRGGDMVNLLGPLGVPFTLPKKKERTVMVAGGIGFPPLLYLAHTMIEAGHPPDKITFIYGGRTGDDIIERSRIRQLGVQFIATTDDGSFGQKGLVTRPAEALILHARGQGERIHLYGCGPEGMLRAVDALGVKYELPGQLALEAPMPCGVGVCLGCIVPRVDGTHLRVCYEGPVVGFGEVRL